VVHGSAISVQIGKSDFLSAEDIQDEGAGGEQGGHKDKKVYEGKQKDEESGKETNFYFPGLTTFFFKCRDYVPPEINLSNRPINVYNIANIYT
jgi:hypothetical protein